MSTFIHAQKLDSECHSTVPVEPPPNASISQPRRTIDIPADLGERLCGDSYDGEEVAKSLNACGFDVIPLGGVHVYSRFYNFENEITSHYEANVAPHGGAHLSTVTHGDRLRAYFTVPLGDQDRCKMPAVKNWQALPFDLAWWKDGETIALPPGWPSWGGSKGKPDIRKGNHERNVGIRTGNGLLVIDIDRKAERDGLRELSNKYGERLSTLLPDTFTVGSPSGGLHMYYTYSSDIEVACSQSVVAPGVDIRADGGLIVGPGSVRLDGRRYVVGKCLPVASLPAEAFDLLVQCKPTSRSKRGQKVVRLHEAVTREEALERVLAKHTDVAPGRRHATLLSVAGTLRNLLERDEDLEWAYRQFAGQRQLDDRELEDLENILADAKTKFERSKRAIAKTPIIVTHDQATVVRELERALESMEWLYQRGGFLVRVVHSGSMRRPTIMLVPNESLAPLTTDYVEWIKVKVDAEGNEEPTPVAPPGWAIAGLAASPNIWAHVRHLDGIVEYPVLRADGSVCARSGYDEALHLLVLDSLGEVQVPDRPTRDDAIRATQELLDVVTDFPFANDAGRSVFLAGVLTPICRFAGIGNVPLILVDKNTRGSGGSLLVDTIGCILKGKKLPRVPQSASDEEQRKFITSVLIAGDDLVLIDNLSHPLGGPSIDALLTGDQWRDRLLGKNELSMVPNRATFYATGNNVEIRGDTTRRTLRVRLESPEERPEERANFRYPDLLDHVAGRRQSLLRAAVTILRAFCVAGRPRQPGVPWGSFEGWWALVASAIVWCGLPDPSLARVSKDESSDTERNELADLLAAWSEIDPTGTGITASQLSRRLQGDRDGTMCPKVREHFVHRNGHVYGAREIGAKLTKLRGRVVGALRLTSEFNRTHTSVWRVEQVGSSAEGPSERTAAHHSQPAEPGPSNSEDLLDLLDAAAG